MWDLGSFCVYVPMELANMAKPRQDSQLPESGDSLSGSVLFAQLLIKNLVWNMANAFSKGLVNE